MRILNDISRFYLQDYVCIYITILRVIPAPYTNIEYPIETRLVNLGSLILRRPYRNKLILRDGV